MFATLLGALPLALGAIARNKLRAVLTVLGVFIGITAVVIVTDRNDRRNGVPKHRKREKDVAA